MLDLPKNIESNIWSCYEVLKIQAFVLTDTLYDILTIPLADNNLMFHVYKIHNLPLLHLIL